MISAPMNDDRSCSLKKCKLGFSGPQPGKIRVKQYQTILAGYNLLTLFHSYFMPGEKVLKKVCSFEVRIICTTV